MLEVRERGVSLGEDPGLGLCPAERERERESERYGFAFWLPYPEIVGYCRFGSGDCRFGSAMGMMTEGA